VRRTVSWFCTIVRCADENGKIIKWSGPYDIEDSKRAEMRWSGRANTSSVKSSSGTASSGAADLDSNRPI